MYKVIPKEKTDNEAQRKPVGAPNGKIYLAGNHSAERSAKAHPRTPYMPGLLAFLLVLLLAGTAVGESADIEALMADMSLHEKVCQLFFVQPEQFIREDKVNKSSGAVKRALGRFPVGGVVLFSKNILNGNTVTALNADMQAWAGQSHGIGLFIGVDEEGGSVSRVAGKLRLSAKQPVAFTLGQLGEAAVEQAAAEIGTYLKGYGFNLDFAPVADVRTDVRREEIGMRAFSYDAEEAACMAAAFIRGLHARGILSVAKHFPGHGAVSGNTHNGAGVSSRTLEEWRACEFLPFRQAIKEGVDMVMVSHQIASKVDPDNPASLSRFIVTELLRGELGYNGVVITDALRMDAIREKCGSGEACVRALEAGCDMLLLPYNFSNGYNGVMAALSSGRLTEDRIDESLRRVLLLKQQWGLIR